MTPMRLRFAPSPTGQLHVGNVRTALFNWMLARRHGATFILRIEDTDRERSTLESERAMIEDLRWLGFDWDEGPDVGGPYAPYRQSERMSGYDAAAKDLLDRGCAYRCFCSPAQLDAERQAALAAGSPPRYSGRCRVLDGAESARRVAAGEPAAIRFAVPAGEREITFRDIVRGDVTVNSTIIGDFVIVRSSGLPNYNFAVVIDDADMKVSIVVRGEDHISNTPRQLLLYEALGRPSPAFAHLSLVLGADHAPLSKRHGVTSVAEFRSRGYLPEALVNYLALLGWSPGEGEEIVPLDEMVRRFDLSTVSHSAAVFDFDKLAWMNRQYMKQLPASRIAADAAPYLTQRGFIERETPEALAYVEALLSMAVGSVDRLEEIPDRVAFVFDWNRDEARRLVQNEPDGVRAVSAFAAAASAAAPLLDRDRFRAAATRTREICGLKGRALLHPLRVALTAAHSGPELDIAVPAIDRGAGLDPACGVAPVLSCLARLRAVLADQ
jgi:glutamyl-tRNA synthetase/nondiscriminating glutamyl-tRNA synthetase